jgi:uncharacterized protein YbjT (DUF2867 family)
MNGQFMKIVVIGGSGFIGSKLVNILRDRGHEVVSASPAFGVNTITGEGLAEALNGADVVVDVSNSPSLEDIVALKFFETSTRKILQAEQAAGVQHHVALSIVGADRIPELGYYRAKVAQEKLIKSATVPYTIVRATQFFEFIAKLTDDNTKGDTVCLSSILMQPVAANDVVSALARAVLGAPVTGIIEVAGPERFRLDELARQFLKAKHDVRTVVADPYKTYFGAEINDESLIADSNSQIGSTRFEDWLFRSTTAH